MPYERTGYAPWSLTREAGVESATVDGTIQVPQYVYPNLDTGFIDEKGVWQGRKSDDRSFIGITKAEGVANSAAVLFPDTNEFPSINMRGFSSLAIAVKTSRSGNYAFDVLMGPDTVAFANLTPVDSGGRLRMINATPSTTPTFSNILEDSNETLTADVWAVLFIYDRCAGQQNMQINITNGAGGEADIEFGFMRLV